MTKTVYKRYSKLVKVLVIAKNIDGGTGTFLTDLLKDKTSFGNQIKIKALVLERPSFRKINTSDYVFLRDKNFYPQRYSLSPVNFINFIRELVWIRNETLIFKPDIVMGIDLRCNLLVVISKILSQNRFKIVSSTLIDLASLTLNISSAVTKIFLKKSIKFFYEKADVLVSVSKGISKHLKTDFDINRNIQTIYIGKNFKIHKQKTFPVNKKVIILSVARLSLQKDYKNLIKAVDLLNKDCDNFELWIAGDGPEKQNLKSLVKKMHMSGKIKFLGWVKNTDELYKKSDIFILSSKSEGFPYVLVEAMSYGLPAISTDCPHGPSEILGKSKYGLLVPMENEKLLKDGMLKLITNRLKYEYFSRQSLKRAKLYSAKKMINLYRKLFIDLTDK